MRWLEAEANYRLSPAQRLGKSKMFDYIIHRKARQQLDNSGRQVSLAPRKIAASFSNFADNRIIAVESEMPSRTRRVERVIPQVRV